MGQQAAIAHAGTEPLVAAQSFVASSPGEVRLQQSSAHLRPHNSDAKGSFQNYCHQGTSGAKTNQVAGFPVVLFASQRRQGCSEPGGSAAGAQAETPSQQPNFLQVLSTGLCSALSLQSSIPDAFCPYFCGWYQKSSFYYSRHRVCASACVCMYSEGLRGVRGINHFKLLL